jgi:ABC-type branched-subunit amino acid transport system ATPase component
MSATVVQRHEPGGLAPPARRPPAAGLSITAKGLSKSFGDKQVLRSLDLAVPAGQFVAVIGCRGCGKSTLLRLDRPTGGAFWFGHGAAAGVPPGAIRLMFQEPRLLPWARVLANVKVRLRSKVAFCAISFATSGPARTADRGAGNHPPMVGVEVFKRTGEVPDGP